MFLSSCRKNDVMLKLLIAILLVDPCSSTPTAAVFVDPYFNTLFTPPTCANDCQTTAIPAAQICKACDISEGGRQLTCSAIPGLELFYAQEVAACITCQAYKRQHGISLLTKYTCDKPYYFTCSTMREQAPWRLCQRLQ